VRVTLMTAAINRALIESICTAVTVTFAHFPPTQTSASLRAAASASCLKGVFTIFGRVCAPPHAAIRGRVPAVCLPLDEQPPDEGAATTLHHQTVGHLSGTSTHAPTRRTSAVTELFVIWSLLTIWLCGRL